MKKVPRFNSAALLILVLTVLITTALAQAGLLAGELNRALYLPLVFRGEPADQVEWTQHAHDAQHTNYTPHSVPPPWRWRWAWNGPNVNGGISKVTQNGLLPRTVQPVTGYGRVYIAAGVDGVFALSEASGAQLWQRSNLGAVNSTVAYDPDTQAVFAVSANGRLYKLRASDGSILGQFSTDQQSDLPLPPAILPDRVLFSMGSKVFAVNKHTLQLIWSYAAGNLVAVPPAYSPSRDLVVIATEPDLYVHAIENQSGVHRWRVRPVHSSRSFGDPTEFRYGWPVIAEASGYVLVRVRLGAGDSLYRVWPRTNPEMRQMLLQYPGDQTVFVLDLDDGHIPFLAHVGDGGYGDGGYLPMGPQPTVKRLANGREVVYIVTRAKHERYEHPWNSYFAEMVLDDQTISGYQGGYVRFIYYDYPVGDETPYLLTDEQPNVSMAGDILFGGHWEAGFAARLLDRSDSYGSFTTRIPTQRLDTIVTSQDWTWACAFSPSHYCPDSLHNTRIYGQGFYIYYNQGNVYDRYWSEYAVWVVSNENVYFRSCDGAIVALTHGNPEPAWGASAAQAVEPTEVLAPDQSPEIVIPYAEARQYAGRVVLVEAKIQYTYNNRKMLLLGFTNPHQGALKVLIRREHWRDFPAPLEAFYRVGQTVQVRGKIGWYQGDPAIYLTSPDQIQVLAPEKREERE